MAYNGFYTRQAQEDALVTQITHPNRVGSGFIDLGPQKRFAPSTVANWQASGEVPPQPLTDIVNASRPPVARPQPPVAQPPPPVAQPVAQPPPPVAQKVAPPASKTAAARTRKPKGGKPDQQRAVGAPAPKAKLVEAVVDPAAQIAADEAFARQLHREMQQMLEEDDAPEPAAAPPVAAPPVAAPAKPRTDAKAKRAAPSPPSPQPASKTPVPPEATAGDATAKRVRALRKKMRDIELLEEKQREGAVLQQDQLDKIAGKAAIVKELGALAGEGKAAIVKELGALAGEAGEKKEDGALADDATSKKVRVLRKKLRDIELLEEKQREGGTLQPNQLVKIDGKDAIVKELGALLI